MGKLKIGLFFGGRSVEHEVSVITALQAYENLDKEKYEAVPIYVSKEGKFYLSSKFLDLKNYQNIDRLLQQLPEVTLARKNNTGGFLISKFIPGFTAIDVALPLFHGSFGEDGCIQGMLEIYQIPYVGFNVLGSSVAMDKTISKYVFKSLGFEVAEFISVGRNDWIENPKKVLKEAQDNLQFPMVVKPADIGSTIGISKAANMDELSFGIEVASAYSDKILIEQAFAGCIEVNCAALGYQEVIPSVCEMPIPSGDTLSYEDKYMKGSKSAKGSKGAGMASLSRKIPAPISRKLTREIQKATVTIFKALEGCGVARIDYFVNPETGQFWVNEVNTPPGSLAYYLYEPIGTSYKDLLDRLIADALKRFADQGKTQYVFESGLLARMGSAVLDKS